MHNAQEHLLLPSAARTIGEVSSLAAVTCSDVTDAETSPCVENAWSFVEDANVAVTGAARENPMMLMTATNAIRFI